MQQRKAEILAKRAKLAELKRQRELRQHEFSQSKASVGDGSEVCHPFLILTNHPGSFQSIPNQDCCMTRLCLLSLAVQIAEQSSMI